MARKFKIKALADLISGDGPLPHSQTAVFFSVSSLGGRGKGAGWASFVRAPIPSVSILPS